MSRNSVITNTDKSLINSFVWSVVLYGSETWITLKGLGGQIRSLRSTLEKSAQGFAAKVKNDEGFRRMNTQTTM